MSAPMHPDEIRARFSKAMSEMFRQEVPLYGTLLDIVAEVNAEALRSTRGDSVQVADARLDVERHGAVRVGSGAELRLLRRAFAVMGMEPVGYYDLAAAGLPIHATAFRPITAEGLARNPFRVFTSVLRPELIADQGLRAEAERTVASRRILTARAESLIAQAEANGGLGEQQVDAFIAELLQTFRWRGQALVDEKTYARLSAAHPLVADIVSFGGPHINHLTPRTLDIDACQAEMRRRGLPVKKTVEGPPRRAVPILLRQTSFTALSEEIAFRSAEGWTKGFHTARFGEIEQRGAALTRRGRALYDRLLAQSGAAGLETVFDAFPDTETALRREGLAYFRYAVGGSAARASSPPAEDGLESLLASGEVVATPIVYEDFLPVSAAGIFRSNLGDRDFGAGKAENAEDRFAAALGMRPHDPFALYERMEQASLTALRRRYLIGGLGSSASPCSIT